MYVTGPAPNMGAGVAPEREMPGEQLQETHPLGLQWARSLLMPCWRYIISIEAALVAYSRNVWSGRR